MGALWGRTISRQTWAATVAGSACCCVVLLAFAPAFPAFATAVVVAVAALIYHRAAARGTSWGRLAARMEAIADIRSSGDPEARVERAIVALEESLALREDRIARRHSLTGLPTREPLLEQIAKDGHGMLGVLSFPDFDRLCAFDPLLGDRLLTAIVARFRSMLSAEQLIAQVDRAQLAVWFPPDVSEASAKAELDAIEYALGGAIQIESRSILPEVRSRLVAVEREDPETLLAATLSRLAIDTMARNSENLATITSADGAHEHFMLEQDLRQAISRGELHMCYQPLIDAARAEICGAEALMRWRHPERGIVRPGEFFSVIETAGLAHEFGLWALNTACRDAHQWRAGGLGRLRVAVNVSARQLERSDLPALVERTLARHALPADALEIELTETAAMVDCERVAGLFAELRRMGVRLAVDDFGTGFSSLSTLRKLAFDKIKIDREFVTEVERRKDSQAICQSVIALARGLNVAVLAEGVERDEEFRWLVRHGCRYFQGYHFSRPLAVADFLQLCGNPADIFEKVGAGRAGLRNRISERLSA